MKLSTADWMLVFNRRWLSDNPVVTTFERSMSPQTKYDWNPWWALILALPFAFGLAFLIPESLQDSAIGSRQNMATGKVTAYDPYNHDSCRYTFTAQGRQFTAIGSCPTHPGVVGAKVPVYFDPADPTKSSLEDFSKVSKRKQGVVFVMIFGVCGVTAFVFLSKLRRREAGS